MGRVKVHLAIDFIPPSLLPKFLHFTAPGGAVMDSGNEVINAPIPGEAAAPAAPGPGPANPGSSGLGRPGPYSASCSQRSSRWSPATSCPTGPSRLCHPPVLWCHRLRSWQGWVCSLESLTPSQKLLRGPQVPSKGISCVFGGGSFPDGVNV